MIQYIVAAGVGALLGSQGKKSRKKYAQGGEVTTDEALAKAEYLEDYGVEAEQLEDQYLGEWDSPEDFVESWIEDTGGMEGLINPERFYEIDKIGFREWAMGMAEAMSEDIDENNADEYAERLDLEMEYSDAVDEDKLDDFIQTLQEKEAEAVYDDFMTNYTTADEIINDLGPNYGMSIEDLERAYLIQPDYTAIADAFEDDGYVYIKKGGKTFVFNYNMKRGGRTKKCMSCGGTTHAKGGTTDKSLERALGRFRAQREASELRDAQARERRMIRQHQSGMSAGAFAKGGQTDDLGNPTDPSVLKEMEVFIENEMPKLDEDRYFTYGMKRKEAKRRFYEKHGYGAYGMDLFAKGGTIPVPKEVLDGKEFIALALDEDGKPHMKFAKTFNGALRMAKNFDKKFGMGYAVKKYDPFYGTRFFEQGISIPPSKEFRKGGKTKRKEVSDFDKLAMKVAAGYRAKGKSNKEAMEIGRGTAANVYRAQQAKKRKK